MTATLFHCYQSALDDPAYQAEQARLIALCDGNPTRTWEAAWSVAQAGSGHRGAEVGAYPLYLSRAFKQSFEHWQATDSFEWAERPEIAGKVPTPEEWTAAMGRGIQTHYANLYCLPWLPQELDCIAAVSVVEHCERDEEALAELCRVARRVVFTTDIAPDETGYSNYGRVYSPTTLQALVLQATGHTLVVGDLPPPCEWLYPTHTVCGLVLEWN